MSPAWKFKSGSGGVPVTYAFSDWEASVDCTPSPFIDLLARMEAGACFLADLQGDIQVQCHAFRDWEAVLDYAPGVLLRDWGASLDVSEGYYFHDLRADMSVGALLPRFTSVVAQRIGAVIQEV